MDSSKKLQLVGSLNLVSAYAHGWLATFTNIVTMRQSEFLENVSCFQLAFGALLLIVSAIVTVAAQDAPERIK